jgi:predicted glycosyltransferase
MKKKPVLLLYCQHSLGMGHLRRSMEMARVLVKQFQLVFLNGGRIPESIPRPEGIEFIDLPALGMGADGVLISQSDKQELKMVKQFRRQIITEQFKKLQPDVLLVELFPFGRKKFMFELLPLLKLAKQSISKPLVICDLRDILVDGRGDQQHFDDRARWLADRYFDTVLIHTDPQFARLEESFKPRIPLKIPLIYTGFVAGVPEPDASYDQFPGIVVSAGGGNVGANLFHSLIEAQSTIWQQFEIPMSIVAGPFLPEPEWNLLKLKAQNKPGLRLYKSVPDLKYLFQNATVSISQCGYNTVMDLLKTRVPALLIPYFEAGENEQTKRALKLEKMGLVRVLSETQLNADTIIQEIEQLLVFTPALISFQMQGAKESCKVIFQLLEKSPNYPTEHYGNVA